MSQQALSPLVQVTQQPVLVISTLHMPIVRLQQQTIMPFIMQHMVHMPPAIMVQRFCIMAQAVGSVQSHMIFMPPAHFSTLKVQRGTIIMFGAIAGVEPIIGFVPMPMPVMPVIAAVGIRSVIMFTMTNSVLGSEVGETWRMLTRPESVV